MCCGTTRTLRRQRSRGWELKLAAEPAASLGDAGRVMADAKIDGARVQVHRDGDAVGVYTRSLRDITAQVRGIVAFVRDLDVSSVILDGEAVSLRADGRPESFQVTMAHLGDEQTAVDPSPTAVRFFDCLHHDGVDLIDRGYEEFESKLGALGARVERL